MVARQPPHLPGEDKKDATSSGSTLGVFRLQRPPKTDCGLSLPLLCAYTSMHAPQQWFGLVGDLPLADHFAHWGHAA